MIKLRNLVTLFSLLLGLLVFGQSDWEKQQLKENPKIVNHIHYTVVENLGVIQKNELIRGVNYTFNTSGFILAQDNYGAKAKPINQIKIVYDTLNNIDHKNVSDAKGILINRITYKYNQKHKPIYKTIYGSDGLLVGRLAYTYHRKKPLQPLQIVSFDKNGQEKEIQDYSYRILKGLKKVKISHPKTKVISNEKVYDKNQNLIKNLSYDVMGNLISKEVYKYKDNQLVVSYYYENDELVLQKDFAYNNIGFLMQEKVQFIQLDKVDNISYTYDFDEKKNWIKKKKYINSIPMFMEERSITYY